MSPETGSSTPSRSTRWMPEYERHSQNRYTNNSARNTPTTMSVQRTHRRRFLGAFCGTGYWGCGSTSGATGVGGDGGRGTGRPGGCGWEGRPDSGPAEPPPAGSGTCHWRPGPGGRISVGSSGATTQVLQPDPDEPGTTRAAPSPRRHPRSPMPGTPAARTYCALGEYGVRGDQRVRGAGDPRPMRTPMRCPYRLLGVRDMATELSSSVAARYAGNEADPPPTWLPLVVRDATEAALALGGRFPDELARAEDVVDTRSAAPTPDRRRFPVVGRRGTAPTRWLPRRADGDVDGDRPRNRGKALRPLRSATGRHMGLAG